jgi:hypothetical protein
MNQNDLENHPLLRMLKNLLNILSVAIFIAGLGLLAWSVPWIWKRRKNASSEIEQIFWTWKLLSSWFMIYAILLFSLLVFDANVLHLGIDSWWPTVSWIVSGPMTHSTSLSMDVFWFLILGFVMLMTDGMFGKVHDNGYYNPPAYVQRLWNIRDLEKRIAEEKAKPPCKDSRFSQWSPEERDKRTTAWGLRLERFQVELEYEKNS